MRATDRESLLRAAAEVFQAKGYRSATIDDIAEAANISRPTVYNYAKSKRWLFDQIVEEMLASLGDSLLTARTMEASPRERLAEVIRTYINATVSHRTYLAVLLTEADMSAASAKSFRTWARQVTQDFRDLLDECVRPEAVAAGFDTMTAANLVVSMLTSLHRWYHPSRRESPDQLVEQILTLLGGVLVEPPTGEQ